MPKRNKKGPRGKGPRTGRGFGPCKKEITKNVKNFFGFKNKK